MGSNLSHIVDLLYPVPSGDRLETFKRLLAEDQNVSKNGRDLLALVLTGAAIFWPHNSIQVCRAQYFSPTIEEREAKAIIAAKLKG